jgi:putative hydrolase of the HAD superfamily
MSKVHAAMPRHGDIMRLGKERVHEMTAGDDGQPAQSRRKRILDPRPAYARFRDRQTWIFDLDNTLYSADSHVFVQIDKRMGQFISELLDVPLPEAKRVQKHYYFKYGTTLSGLMHEHKLPPDRFLDFVHDIDLSELAAVPELAKAIAELPGRKFVFTNGSMGHAERVTEKLGLAHLFDGLFDIRSANYVPKPKREAYEAVMKSAGAEGARSAMFEDLPHNLEVPHAMGMATVLVRTEYEDHPAHRDVDRWDTLPAHVHHFTEDLTQFLSDLIQELKAR